MSIARFVLALVLLSVLSAAPASVLAQTDEEPAGGDAAADDAASAAGGEDATGEDGAGEDASSGEDAAATTPPPPPPTPPVPPPAPAGDTTPPPSGSDAFFQQSDTEQAGPSRAPTPESPEVVAEGTRLFLQVQTNTPVGELLADPTGSTGGFAFDRATLAGVPDAFVGVRFDRFSAGLGLSWLSINTPQDDPCDADNDLENSATLVGFIPSLRYDVLTTPDGRGRFETGVAVPLIASSTTRELAGSCFGGAPRETQERTDGLYGFDLLFGGRYHVWSALTIGAELGLSYLVFDFDADPSGDDQPSVTTLTIYSGLTLTIEAPL